MIFFSNQFGNGGTRCTKCAKYYCIYKYIPTLKTNEVGQCNIYATNLQSIFQFIIATEDDYIVTEMYECGIKYSYIFFRERFRLEFHISDLYNFFQGNLKCYCPRF